MIGDKDEEIVQKSKEYVEFQIKKFGWTKVARWIESMERERKRRSKNAARWKREHPAEYAAYCEAYNERRRKEHKAWRDSVKEKQM